MQSPFDSLLSDARAALDAANDRYNAVLDRLNARTAADDAPGGDLAEVQAAFRDVQIECYKAEATLGAAEAWGRIWEEVRAQRPDASERELLIAFRRVLSND